MINGRNTLTAPAELLPHVLMISNHWEIRQQYPSAGIFVDRQLMSLSKIGVKVSTFDIGTSHSPFHLLKKWLQLRRKVRHLRPDIVHAHYGTIVGFLAVFAGPPAVISFCGADLIASASVSVPRRYVGYLLSNLAALRASRIICKSNELMEALWWRRERAVVIPSGVDLSLFSPGPQEAARKELGWKIGRPVAIFNSRDAKLKGLHLVEAAMKVVRSRVSDAELFIISDVEPSQMPTYYRAADVLICASKAEGSPNMVKEALACNLPIVSTDVGDVAERLAGVHPSYVVPRQPGDLAEAITKILLARQRSNGREHVSGLGLDQIARHVGDVYQSIL